MGWEMPDRAHSAGLVVFWRFNLWSGENPARPRQDAEPALPLSNAEVAERYRGFDSWPWPDGPGLKEIHQVDLNDFGLGFGGVAPLEQFGKVIAYYQAVSDSRRCDLVFLDFPWRSGPSVKAPSGFSFCGYDYGLYASPGQRYSCIFHEVIYAQDEELVAMARRLNDCLLLPSLDLVDSLAAIRRQLLAVSAPLEIESEWFPYEAIAVYAYPRLYGAK